MINKILLPQTDCYFSALSLGTVKFGRNQSVKYPQQFSMPSDKELSNLLSLCTELGISTLDTAPAYGIAEERLGKLLKGQRQQFEIISKAGESYNSASDTSNYDYSSKALNKQLEQSLKLVNSDYLDCWMLHSNGNDVENLRDEVIQCLLDAKQAGKAKSVGLSGKTVSGGKIALQYLDTLMMTRNLQYQEEDELLAQAKNFDKKVFLKKIFNSGWVVESAITDKQQAMIDTFSYCFNSPQVCSAVIGTINPKHLKENVSTWQTAQSIAGTQR